MSLLSEAAASAAIAILVGGFAAAARAQTAPSPAAIASPALASAQLKPGTIVSAANAAEYARYLPAAAQFAVAHGFEMRTVAARRVEWSEGFRHATEKYSPQVKLAADDTIMNYVAGMPFPLVDAADPKAAVKIAYNWHMGPFMPDDFSLAPWGSTVYRTDPANPVKIVADGNGDYECEQFDFLRFAHRTDVDPRPTLGDNPMGVEWKARCVRWTVDAGTTAHEGAGIWVRYADPHRADEFFGFSEQSRRVRRSAVSLDYPTEACRGCHQPYWAYALPKTENYTYRLLGTATLLACLRADDEPAGFKRSNDAIALGQEPFELRNAYIIEMTPRTAEAASRKTIVYIDSEIYVWLAADFYDEGGLAATAMPLWRMRPAAEGGNLFDLAGSFYHPARGGSLFRSLVPAHGDFKQSIDTGAIPEAEFNPQMMTR